MRKQQRKTTRYAAMIADGSCLVAMSILASITKLVANSNGGRVKGQHMKKHQLIGNIELMVAAFMAILSMDVSEEVMELIMDVLVETGEVKG